MTPEGKIIALEHKENLYEELGQLKSDVATMKEKTKSIEKQLDTAEDNKLILKELQIVINELVEWRKASEIKMQQQNDTQIRMTMILEQLTETNKKQDEQIEAVATSVNNLKTDGSVTFNEVLKAGLAKFIPWLIGLVIGILGWASK